MDGEITEEMREAIDSYNDMISRANERIDQLIAANFEVRAREGAQGVTITKRHKGAGPGRGYESMWTSEIIVRKGAK